MLPKLVTAVVVGALMSAPTAPANAYPGYGGCEMRRTGYIEFYTCRDHRGVIVDSWNCDTRASGCYRYGAR
jgi:hypothetical protein